MIFVDFLIKMQSYGIYRMKSVLSGFPPALENETIFSSEGIFKKCQKVREKSENFK